MRLTPQHEFSLVNLERCQCYILWELSDTDTDWQVLMKDMGSPIAVEEVRNVIRKCLQDAALINYSRISEFAKIEGE